MRALPVLILAVLLGAGCVATSAPKSAMSPKQRGEARARADIAAGEMRILYYGKPWSVGKPLKDDRTGLPVEIVEGCEVSAEFVEETDAYNAVMHGADRRPPAQ